MKNPNGWIGVDLDGTLAFYEGCVCRKQKPDDANAAYDAIQAWCLKHLGQLLDVTAEKDFDMTSLWDDRAVTVEKNTGRFLSPLNA